MLKTAGVVLQKGGQAEGATGARDSHKEGGRRGEDDGAGIVGRSACVLAGMGLEAGRAMGETDPADRTAYRMGFDGVVFNSTPDCWPGGAPCPFELHHPLRLIAARLAPRPAASPPRGGRGGPASEMGAVTGYPPSLTLARISERKSPGYRKKQITDSREGKGRSNQRRQRRDRQPLLFLKLFL